MSTKRLQRTVIEGGRVGSNKWARRQSHKEEKAQVRQYLSKVMADPEHYEEELEPEIGPVYKDFKDKLSPMYRWLEKQAGRPWADVRSEVFQKFDTRTTAGRHITFDHLLREIVDTESGFDRWGRMANPNIELEESKEHPWRFRFSTASYYVDEVGILQASEHNPRRRHYYRSSKFSKEQYEEVSKWLNGRIIGVKQDKHYWFCPTEGEWKACWAENDWGHISKLKYFIWDNGAYSEIAPRLRTIYGLSPSITFMTHGDHWQEVENPFSFRQRGELTKEELKYFKELPESVRTNILEFSKGR